MALHNQVRFPIAFDNKTLLTPIGAGGVQAASVLLRTAALVALTHRENGKGAVPNGVNTPEVLKIAPAHDCLFVFSNKGVSFPGPRHNDNIDLIVANNELNLVGPLAKTAADFKGYMTMTEANKIAAAWPANVPTADEEIIPELIFYHYNDNVVNAAANNITFFDEVNAVHNIHKEIARSKINMVRAIAPDYITTSIANQGPAITMPLRCSGNFEGTQVQSWGAYGGKAAHIARESNAFMNLRNQLAGIIAIGMPLNEHVDVSIFRDLYRLECIREPAALITNAMFVDLASSISPFDDSRGYQSINEYYHFNEIRTLMPMSPRGAVNAARVLWSRIIDTHTALLPNANPIYYRYDYTSLEMVADIAPLNGINSNGLSRLENNLLFNYITWKVDLPVVNGGGGADITDRLLTVFNMVNRAAQIDCLTDIHDDLANRWIQQPAPNNRVYRRMVNIPGIGDIIFEARFPNLFPPPALLTVTHIFITSFPLALINELLVRWYRVNIGLPNQQIEIDLQLRV